MRNIHLVILLASLGLGGCNTMQEAKMSESFQSSYDNVVAVKEKAADGAIYSAAQTGFFSGDRRARNVGDVLTVNINVHQGWRRRRHRSSAAGESAASGRAMDREMVPPGLTM